MNKLKEIIDADEDACSEPDETSDIDNALDWV